MDRRRMGKPTSVLFDFFRIMRYEQAGDAAFALGFFSQDDKEPADPPPAPPSSPPALMIECLWLSLGGTSLDGGFRFVGIMQQGISCCPEAQLCFHFNLTGGNK
ncbi:hypothetical protein CHARACLAT_021913 [Characodon lateralis]|uniref:Uncharacterized protein n=1 Tax=Characodon lateralis TaxID=208331 RepID=A0ABU7EVT0_9TELE|nr:hypothetical protein [Characodon lateralis]